MKEAKAVCDHSRTDICVMRIEDVVINLSQAETFAGWEIAAHNSCKMETNTEMSKLRSHPWSHRCTFKWAIRMSKCCRRKRCHESQWAKENRFSLFERVTRSISVVEILLESELIYRARRSQMAWMIEHTSIWFVNNSFIQVELIIVNVLLNGANLVIKSGQLCS